MRTATIKIKGLTPYSQSRALQSEKRKEETYDSFDRRVCGEHMHVDAKTGLVFIPAVAILQGMAAAASYLSKGGDIKKKGTATWSQNFLCGLSVSRGATIGIKPTDVKFERVYCNADGKRGSGKRVWRTFPVYEEWAAELTIELLDDTIPEDVFRQVLVAFGLFVGIGRYRPQNGGYLGRFTVKEIKID